MPDDDLEPMTDPSTQQAPTQSSDPNAATAGAKAIQSDSPGENAPEIPEKEEGHAEGDDPPYTRPYTPQEKMDIAIDRTRKSRESIDQLHQVTKPMWDKYQQMLQQDQQMRESMSADQTQQIQQQQASAPTQQKKNFLEGFATMMAVAVPIALAFGLRGNGYAKGAAMSALGSAMTNFAHGFHGAAEEDMHNYNQQVKAIHESNQERHQIYKDILANHRMELDDQFKMIHAVSQEFMDPYMAKASKDKDINAVIKQLDNQEKVDQRFMKGTNKINKIVHPAKWNDYVQYMKDKHHVDPNTDQQKADQILNYTDWSEKYATAGERKDTEEKAEQSQNDTTIDSDKAKEIRQSVLGDE